MCIIVDKKFDPDVYNEIVTRWKVIGKRPVDIPPWIPGTVDRIYIYDIPMAQAISMKKWLKAELKQNEYRAVPPKDYPVGFHVLTSAADAVYWAKNIEYFPNFPEVVPVQCRGLMGSGHDNSEAAGTLDVEIYREIYFDLKDSDGQNTEQAEVVSV